jgi:hypothetical protein
MHRPSPNFRQEPFIHAGSRNQKEASKVILLPGPHTAVEVRSRGSGKRRPETDGVTAIHQSRTFKTRETRTDAVKKLEAQGCTAFHPYCNEKGYVLSWVIPAT